MICPHCNKRIEDRWIYPVGTQLFRRGLHHSYKNVKVIGHDLSIEGFPVYIVEETYCLNYEDSDSEPCQYIACANELSIFEQVKETMIVIPES